ncbi:hypothetical protein EST62_00070, partial [Chlorobaculum sp. 24CR]|uniref:hypothetical protein n=1 Tax=Chlorobaculum sp. 24CR TaxID=2508878 RepID=UPI00100AE7B8
MKIQNHTKAQHFVSQAELRLNACNPDAQKQSNFKIFEFNVINREKYQVDLLSEKGRAVDKALALDDLFSFDVKDKEVRANLESLFQSYENMIAESTKKLLIKIGQRQKNLSDELDNIFKAKLLNSFRNPYCIQKTLNTVGLLAAHHPTDPFLNEVCERIKKGQKPHQKYLCEKLGISNSHYEKWLHVLFMLLTPLKPLSLNMLESIINSLYFKPSNYLSAFIFTYTGEHTDKRPLVSDRSFSTPIDNDSTLAFSNKGSSKQSFEVFRRVGAAVNATFYTQFLDL